MKVFVQIVDTRNGISQHGMIDESIQEGFEVANAIGHFGVDINTVEWNNNFTDKNLNTRFMSGTIMKTSKVLNVIIIGCV